MTNPSVSWRQRIGTRLRSSRWVAAVEVIVVVLLQGMQAFGLVSAAILYLFGLSWLSLWLRQCGWRSLGLSRPTHWPRTIALGVTVGLVYQLVSLWLVTPLLQQLTRQPLDLSQLAPLRANLGLLLIALVASWTLGAFVEELVYRGYVLHRLVDLVGHLPAGWTIGVLGSSALFGWGHAYQGLTGIIETALFGCVMAGLYLLARRQLWLPIIAHGVYDTLAFILIYLGWYP